MFNIFSNRQASSRDLASRLQSLMHISKVTALMETKGLIPNMKPYVARECFLRFEVGALEILSCDMVQHVLIGVTLQELRRKQMYLPAWISMKGIM